MIYGGQTSGWFSVLQGIGATATISPPVLIGIGDTLAVAGIYLLSPRQQDIKLSIESFKLMNGIDVYLTFVIFCRPRISFDRAYFRIWSKGLSELVSPAGVYYYPNHSFGICTSINVL